MARPQGELDFDVEGVPISTCAAVGVLLIMQSPEDGPCLAAPPHAGPVSKASLAVLQRYTKMPPQMAGQTEILLDGASTEDANKPFAVGGFMVIT